jgi:hypothetical protein
MNNDFDLTSCTYTETELNAILNTGKFIYTNKEGNQQEANHLNIDGQIVFKRMLFTQKYKLTFAPNYPIYFIECTIEEELDFEPPGIMPYSIKIENCTFNDILSLNSNAGNIEITGCPKVYGLKISNSNNLQSITIKNTEFTKVELFAGSIMSPLNIISTRITDIFKINNTLNYETFTISNSNIRVTEIENSRFIKNIIINEDSVIEKLRFNNCTLKEKIQIENCNIDEFVNSNSKFPSEFAIENSEIKNINIDLELYPIGEPRISKKGK